jgi:hypothetical protein
LIKDYARDGEVIKTFTPVKFENEKVLYFKDQPYAADQKLMISLYKTAPVRVLIQTIEILQFWNEFDYYNDDACLCFLFLKKTRL